MADCEEEKCEDSLKRDSGDDITLRSKTSRKKPVPTPRRGKPNSLKGAFSDSPGKRVQNRQSDHLGNPSSIPLRVEGEDRGCTKSSEEPDAVAESNTTNLVTHLTSEKNGDVNRSSDYIPSESSSDAIEHRDTELLQFILKHGLGAVEQTGKDLGNPNLRIVIEENRYLITGGYTEKEISLARDKIDSILNGITHDEKIFEKQDVDKLKDEDLRTIENRCNTHIHIKKNGTTALQDSGLQTDSESWPEYTEQALTYSLSSNEDVLCYNNGIRITLVKGLLEKQKDDVIVCNTPKDLNLSVSPRNRRILKYWGQNLQSEIRSKYPDGTAYGEIATIEGGQLHAHEIYLGALPKWDEDTSCKTIINFIRNCLEKADTCRSIRKTISFPALGTGKLGYPRNKIAEIMYDTVIEFDLPNGSITGVTFVCYHDDKDTCKAFELEHEKRIMSERNKSEIGNIKLSIFKDDLGRHKADVLVCACSTNLDLKHSGGASKSLYVHGGKKKLKKKISNSYHNGFLKCGEIAVIAVENLPCKEIYLTSLPEDERETQETLREVVYTCLTKADASRHKSIGFAALGTGKLGYSASVVARNMFTVVHKYSTDHDYTIIKDVHFVLYPDDEKTIKAFEEEEGKLLTPDSMSVTSEKVKIRIYGQTAAERENTFAEINALFNQKAQKQS